MGSTGDYLIISGMLTLATAPTDFSIRTRSGVVRARRYAPLRMAREDLMPFNALSSSQTGGRMVAVRGADAPARG
jgi:hypothetical protein